MSSHKVTEERVNQAIEDAEIAFWESIVKSFPEVTTGDCDPLQAAKFNAAMEKALQDWLDWNHPDRQEDA